jgi:hypothetical protein
MRRRFCKRVCKRRLVDDPERPRAAVPWVTGVLCVDEDRPPEQRDRVWVVSHRDLIAWLEAQRNQPVDPEQARATLLA